MQGWNLSNVIKPRYPPVLKFFILSWLQKKSLNYGDDWCCWEHSEQRVFEVPPTEFFDAVEEAGLI